MSESYMDHNLGDRLLFVRVKKEYSTEKASYVNLKVISQLNEVDPYFRVRRDHPLQQLFIKWCARANVKDYRGVRFVYEGVKVDENKTPDDMKLVDYDSIHAWVDQLAG